VVNINLIKKIWFKIIDFIYDSFNDEYREIDTMGRKIKRKYK